MDTPTLIAQAQSIRGQAANDVIFWDAAIKLLTDGYQSDVAAIKAAQDQATAATAAATDAQQALTDAGVAVPDSVTALLAAPPVIDTTPAAVQDEAP